MFEFYIPGKDEAKPKAASEWSYRPDQPREGEHSKADLDKVLGVNQFTFDGAKYTPGELGYLSSIAGRLLASFRQAREKITEDDADHEKKAESAEQLINVTVNRGKLIHRALAEHLQKRESITYYRSRVTGAPYIDAGSRVFLFTDPLAWAKAEERAKDDQEFELAQAKPAELSRLLYLNGCNTIVFNDGYLAFAGDREDFLPLSETAETIAEPARALRFFCLAFLQVLRGTQDGDKQKTLTMLESQISARLIQSRLPFKASSQEGDRTQFVILTDGNDHTALGCFTDQTALPDDEGYYPEIPFITVAQQFLAEENPIGGIILNPGTMNFYLDRNWLTRLVRFAEKLVQAAKEKQAEHPEDTES